MKNSSSRNVAGIVLILLGGLWFLGNTNLFYFDVWDYFWPVVFITIGIVLAVKGKALVLATIFIFFGSLNLISNMFYINFDFLFHTYWPLILIALGLLILFRKRDGRWERRHRDDRAACNPFYSNSTENKSATGTEGNTGAAPNQEEKPNEDPFDESKKQATYQKGPNFEFFGNSKSTYYSDKESTYYSDPNFSYYKDKAGFTPHTGNIYDADRIDEVAVLTSIRKFITSQNFKGGEVKTILGGGIIDLSGAKLAEGDNVIELTSIMGGVTFRVPQEWKVIVNVHSIFGGFEDKRRFFSPAQPTATGVLIIKGTVIMGGGTVTY